jgi:hypothetical protein
MLALAVALTATLACEPAPEPLPGASGDATAKDGPTNTLKWTAATEQGVYGYLVYRSTEREGPFLRQNERIVRVPADGAATHGYEWADRNVEPGRTYYYYLVVVSEAGIKQRFSGIIARTTAAGPEP